MYSTIWSEIVIGHLQEYTIYNEKLTEYEQYKSGPEAINTCTGT